MSEVARQRWQEVATDSFGKSGHFVQIQGSGDQPSGDWMEKNGGKSKSLLFNE